MIKKETEIKAKLTDTSKLEKFLNESAEYLGEKRQEDIFYTPSSENFALEKPIKRILRIRKTGDKSIVTYKHKRNDSDLGKIATEYETTVADPVAIASIFNELEFIEIAQINKIRKSWKYKEYEVVFDKVDGVGEFIEVEYVGSGDNEEEIVNDIISFIKEAANTEIKLCKESYISLLLFPEEAVFKSV
jgi:adenylate cyclase class 2